MKIILVKDVIKLGKKLDLKRVKPGYARNFLIPQRLALPATKKNLKWREKQLKNQEKEKKENIEKIRIIADKLKKFTLEIPVKTGLKGEIFQKIDEAKVAKILQKEDFDIKKENIKIRKTITKTGNYFAGINFGDGIAEELKIKVKKEEVREKKKLKPKKIKLSKKGK